MRARSWQGEPAEEPCAPLSSNLELDVSQLYKSASYGHWHVEASELGWPPGLWPTSFKVKGLGNGERFRRIKADESSHVYAQEFGCVNITVFND